MKKFQVAVLAGAITVTTVAAHAAESPHKFTANVAMTTDYAFRGISQTNEKTAIQGGFDYGHSSGFYAGVWGSNVDFAGMEIDWYGGYASTIGSTKIGWDAGAIYYNYTAGIDAFDFWEVYGKLSYDFGVVAVKGGINYSNDYFGESGNATYVYGDVDMPLGKDFGLTFHLGRQTIDDEAAFGAPDYWDYKIAANYSYGGFGFSLAFVDTDLSKSECGGLEICDSRVIFTVSKSM